MRPIVHIVAFGLVFAPAWSAADDGVLPSGPAEHDAALDFIERRATQPSEVFPFTFLPPSTEFLDTNLRTVSHLRAVPPGLARLFTTASSRVAASLYDRGSALELFRLGGVGRPTKHLSVYASAALDESRAKDPAYRGKKWRGLAGDIEYAFGRFVTGRFELLAGRFANYWGIRRSLVFAETTSLDGFAYRFGWGKLSLGYRLARLDGLNPERDGVPQFENRYLAAHRLDIRFSPRFRLGLFETVVFGGPGRNLDLFYLNPLLFFHGAQLNEGTNDNTFLGFDFTVRPSDGLSVYGQLLVDDFQIDDRTASDQEPNEWGVRLGFYAADVLSGLDIRTEYTRVTNWTFNQVLPRNRYLFEGQPIGDVRGNDYDEVAVTVRRWLSSTAAITLGTEYRRQGEGRILAAWTQPWLSATDGYEEPFPTGVVWRTLSLTAGARMFLAGHVYLDAVSGLEIERNRLHQKGDNRTRPYLHLRLSILLSTLLRPE